MAFLTDKADSLLGDRLFLLLLANQSQEEIVV